MLGLINRYKGSYASYSITLFFFYFSMSVFSSVLSVYLTGIGKNPSEMSFIVSSSSLFSIICMPIVGFLNDKVKNPKRLGGVLLISAGVLGIAFSFARETWILFLLNGFIMTGICSMSPVLERMAGLCKYRYGSVRVWGTLGFASAIQIAGLILQYLPSQYLFVLLLITTLLTVVGILGTEPIAKEKLKDTVNVKPKLRDFLKTPHYILYLFIVFLFLGANGVHMTYIPVLLSELGMDLGVVGTVLFLGTAIEIPMLLFAYKFMDKYSSRNLVIIAHVLLATPFLFYGFSNNIIIVVGITLMFKSIPSMLFTMLNLKVVSNLVSPKLTSTALGISSAFMSIGGLAFQNLGGTIAYGLGTQELYTFLAGITALSLVLTLFLKVPNIREMFSN